MTKPLVIYHADCTDGYGAAFAAWSKLGDAAEYAPAHYGDPALVLPKGTASSDFNAVYWLDRDIYILDFSLPRQSMDWLFIHAKRVVWLDHHKTAFEMYVDELERVGDVYTLLKPRHYTILNNNKSGALLAWEYFHPGVETPMLVQHIDDRDRWQWKLEGSAEIHAALGSYKPWTFEAWRTLLRETHVPNGGSTGYLTDFKNQGHAILRAQKQHVEQMAKQARKCNIPYSEVPTPKPVAIGLAVNASIHQSEVGHELANQSGTYGLVYYVGADGRCRCSLRSNGEYDVSAIARSFGGGGHRNAAGFEIDIETLMGWLR